LIKAIFFGLDDTLHSERQYASGSGICDDPLELGIGRDCESPAGWTNGTTIPGVMVKACGFG
jgi:hypothetical protein